MILTDMTNKKDAQHWGCASLSTKETANDYLTSTFFPPIT